MHCYCYIAIPCINLSHNSYTGVVSFQLENQIRYISSDQDIDIGLLRREEKREANAKSAFSKLLTVSLNACNNSI